MVHASAVDKRSMYGSASFVLHCLIALHSLQALGVVDTAMIDCCAKLQTQTDTGMLC